MGEWTDKLVYCYDSIIHVMEYNPMLQWIYYNENKCATATCNNMDDAHLHSVDQKNADTKMYIPYNSVYMKVNRQK